MTTYPNSIGNIWTCDCCTQAKHANSRYPRPTGPGPHVCGKCRGRVKAANRKKAQSLRLNASKQAVVILTALKPMIEQDVIDVTFPEDKNIVLRFEGDMALADVTEKGAVTAAMAIAFRDARRRANEERVAKFERARQERQARIDAKKSKPLADRHEPRVG